MNSVADADWIGNPASCSAPEIYFLVNSAYSLDHKRVHSVLKNLEQVLATTQAFVRRHWQRALRIREKIWVSEEAFHLLLAGGVGVIGGLVNLGFHHSIDLTEKLF